MNSGVVHAGPCPRLIGNEGPGIVTARRNKGPTIVMTGEENVHFVTAHGPNLRLPEFPGFRMKREPVSIAMAIGEDFGLRPRTSHKRVVRRHRAVISKAERFSDMVSRIL